MVPQAVQLYGPLRCDCGDMMNECKKNDDNDDDDDEDDDDHNHNHNHNNNKNNDPNLESHALSVSGSHI